MKTNPNRDKSFAVIQLDFANCCSLGSFQTWLEFL